ncbi:MAG TPA: 1-acyl-sn-glycerol-3-phosphate acyltransferase [Bacteroidales bacterium]|nr:1-acyl-sn-glycerol-3-phosphate acyltransferase [Bacteroidales bacterium]HOS58143.1 1-acyl-sn-glycerol-3-phosphate acyltransferase [Bacteroidales bacterium]
MISFEKIDKYSLRYALLYQYVKVVHHYIYHSDFDVLGTENIPPKGTPTLVISNHQNGLLDALGIIYAFKDGRQPVFIARGDIFKNKTAAKLLRFLKIMPAFRTIDVARSEVNKSNVTFLRAARVLIDGGTVAIFPEAGHEETHHLGSFKKGYPRIAFKAEEEADFKLNLQILPVANHYSNYLNFRQKKVIVIGKPFSFSELFDIYKNKPNDAYLKLNEISREKIEEMMLDIKDLSFYEEYRMLNEIIRKEYLTQIEKPLSYFPNHLIADKETTSKLDLYRTENAEQFSLLMTQTRQYLNNLKTLNLRNWLIGKKVTFFNLLLTTFLFLLALPFYLFSLINNYLPFHSPNIFTRKIEDEMLHSSFNIVVGSLFSFPLFYLLYFIIVWIVSGNILFGLIYVILALLSLFLFYYYRVGVIKLFASWRYYNFKRKSNQLLIKTIELKNNIFGILKKIIRNN